MWIWPPCAHTSIKLLLTLSGFFSTHSSFIHSLLNLYAWKRIHAHNSTRSFSQCVAAIIRSYLQYIYKYPHYHPTFPSLSLSPFPLQWCIQKIVSCIGNEEWALVKRIRTHQPSEWNANFWLAFSWSNTASVTANILWSIWMFISRIIRILLYIRHHNKLRVRNRINAFRTFTRMWWWTIYRVRMDVLCNFDLIRNGIMVVPNVQWWLFCSTELQMHSGTRSGTKFGSILPDDYCWCYCYGYH